MAINIIRDWYSIIINVSQADSKLEGGLISLLSELYPRDEKKQESKESKKKGFFAKIKSLFSDDSLDKKEDAVLEKNEVTLHDFDNLLFGRGGNCVGMCGCDGNLYYISYSSEAKILDIANFLESEGLSSNLNGDDCDFFIYSDDCNLLHPCLWLTLLMKENPASKECISSCSAHLSINPFQMPYTLIGEYQGGNSFHSKLVWEQFQKYVRDNNAEGMRDLMDIQIRHLNARIKDKSTPSLDEFVRAYAYSSMRTIPIIYRYIIDGSKDDGKSLKTITTYFNESKEQDLDVLNASTQYNTSSSALKEKEYKHINEDKIPNNILGKYYNLEQIKSKQIGNSLLIQPIDWGLVTSELKEIELITTLYKESPNIKKFLPGLDWSAEDKTRNFFKVYCQLTELGYHFGYTIRIGALVAGIIFINTPDYSLKTNGVKEWTIDFTVFNLFEGQHIIRATLPHIMAFLKYELNVQRLYAIVDKNNVRCISLISKLFFEDTKQIAQSPNGSSSASLYECNLRTLNFK